MVSTTMMHISIKDNSTKWTEKKERKYVEKHMYTFAEYVD